MGGMSSAVIGGFCEHSPVVHELVAKFADMTAKETAKEHGWQLKEATHSGVSVGTEVQERGAQERGLRNGGPFTFLEMRFLYKEKWPLFLGLRSWAFVPGPPFLRTHHRRAAHIPEALHTPATGHRGMARLPRK
jgi:hypothetical protein